MKVQVIVEDAQTSEGDTDPKWLKFQGHLLTESDRKAIVSNDLLNDRHINYAQNLLHYQFPAVEGLHDTLFQRKKLQQKIICGIQIVHNRENHWIVASTISSCKSVQVYDSIYSTVNDEIADVIKNLFEVTDEMKIDIKKIQTDWLTRLWTFALAVSTVLLHGLDVSQITFCQKEMRRRLISCFIAKSLTPFPT